MSQTTSSGISTYCLKNNLEHTVVALPHDASIHFVGHHPTQPQPDSKLLLYIHGGGYVTPIAPPQISLPLSFAKHIPTTSQSPSRHSGSEIPGASVAFLEFTLAPRARFPVQIAQILTALTHLLKSYHPRQIILGGESSGGHLILAALSYLSHPDPSVCSPPLPLVPDSKFAGAFLISPLVDRSISADSYTRNASTDFTDVRRLPDARALWAPDPTARPLDRAYLDPLDAQDGWWTHLPVSKILVTAGAWETMLDDCVAFGKRLQAEATEVDVKTVQCPFEVHASCIVEETFGIKAAEGGSRRAVEVWLGGF
jgi:acetyl esterase/lipase